MFCTNSRYTNTKRHDERNRHRPRRSTTRVERNTLKLWWTQEREHKHNDIRNNEQHAQRKRSDRPQQANHHEQTNAHRNHAHEHPLVHARINRTNLVSKHLHIRFSNRYDETNDKRNGKQQRQISLRRKSRAAPLTNRKNTNVNAKQKNRKPENEQHTAYQEANNQVTTKRRHRHSEQQHNHHDR